MGEGDQREEAKQTKKKAQETSDNISWAAGKFFIILFFMFFLLMFFRYLLELLTIKVTQHLPLPLWATACGGGTGVIPKQWANGNATTRVDIMATYGRNEEMGWGDKMGWRQRFDNDRVNSNKRHGPKWLSSFGPQVICFSVHFSFFFVSTNFCFHCF